MKRLFVTAVVVVVSAVMAQSLSFHGSGDDFFDLGLTEPMVAVISHQGSSNFVVMAYDAAGRRDLLVNVIGTYAGVVPVGIEGELPVEVTVNADGVWRIEMVPLTQASAAAQVTRGVGDVVLRVGHLAPRALTATHDGTSNFVIRAYGARRTLLVNEIGPYSGRLRVADGTAYLVVNADGNWELRLE